MTPPEHEKGRINHKPPPSAYCTKCEKKLPADNHGPLCGYCNLIRDLLVERYTKHVRSR